MNIKLTVEDFIILRPPKNKLVIRLGYIIPRKQRN